MNIAQIHQFVEYLVHHNQSSHCSIDVSTRLVCEQDEAGGGYEQFLCTMKNMFSRIVSLACQAVMNIDSLLSHVSLSIRRIEKTNISTVRSMFEVTQCTDTKRCKSNKYVYDIVCDYFVRDDDILIDSRSFSEEIETRFIFDVNV
jgi:hypothetical protein